MVCCFSFRSGKCSRSRHLCGCSRPHSPGEDAGDLVLVHRGEGGDKSFARGGQAANVIAQEKVGAEHENRLQIEGSLGQPQFTAPARGIGGGIASRGMALRQPVISWHTWVWIVEPE